MLTNRQVNEMLNKITIMFQEKMEELSKYDSVIGDGDHGITMARGTKAAFCKISLMKEDTICDQFKVYGRTMISELGGAIGPLFGTIFIELAKASKDRAEFGPNELAHGITNANEKIFKLGGAVVGDKTMVDAIAPTSISLLNSLKNSENMLKMLAKGVEAAKKGMTSTIDLKAKKDRSKYLQEKSIGYQDAGATSFYYFMKIIYEYAIGCES